MPKDGSHGWLVVPFILESLLVSWVTRVNFFDSDLVFWGL